MTMRVMISMALHRWTKKSKRPYKIRSERSGEKAEAHIGIDSHPLVATLADDSLTESFNYFLYKAGQDASGLVESQFTALGLARSHFLQFYASFAFSSSCEATEHFSEANGTYVPQCAISNAHSWIMEDHENIFGTG
ncbi:hypothetical protein R1sor_009817 [Riccia sorocarpa]|uniref:Uncharacterized protein n=1 Tax=Riccia sorocarpa TaxID=122646 RepID=A0ABD3I0A3_9MARC